jgi:magnesium-protoporphyrin IX monomethyl ester (oxidative) cyclase
MRFRAKSHDRVMSDFDTLSSRYGVNSFQMADNILDMQHLRTVIPALAQAGAPYEIFYEIKANLRREQVLSLAAAGVTKVQPGIESLHDDLLKLMAKGSTAAINIELMKHLREAGIDSGWYLLVGFPGEDDHWHAEVAAWLPLISHLQPPAGVVQVRYDRFSVYHQDPARYSLSLSPYPAYSSVYPSKPERLQDLAYFFRDANSAIDPPDAPGLAALKSAVKLWQRVFGQELRPVLCALDRGDVIEIFDTRPAAIARRTELGGLEAGVYRACQPPATRDALHRRFISPGAATEAEVDAAIAGLESKAILLNTHGKFIALAVPGDMPSIKGRDQPPGGWTRGTDLPFHIAVARARAHLLAVAPSQESIAVPALVD